MNVPKPLENYEAFRKVVFIPGRRSAEIASRVQGRIESLNLHATGVKGASFYITKYGKNIGFSKVLDLANHCFWKFEKELVNKNVFDFCETLLQVAYVLYLKANLNEHIECIIENRPNSPSSNCDAVLFRDKSNNPKRVYKMEFPLPPHYSKIMSSSNSVIDVNNMELDSLDEGNVDNALAETELPEFSVPGSYVTMQPVDALEDDEFYITNPGYWGQPKRDGQKLVVFATDENVFFQTRSGRMIDVPFPGFIKTISDVVEKVGQFVLEGELFWIDSLGKEHKTGKEAIKSNETNGFSSAKPSMVFSAFHCVWWDGMGKSNPVDENTLHFQRVRIAEAIMKVLEKENPSNFETMRTYVTEKEKRELYNFQLETGNEGMVWFADIPYSPGKTSKQLYVRSKFLTEPIQYRVTDINLSDKKGHYIAGFSVADINTGEDRGIIGTGYTKYEQIEILKRWSELREDFLVYCVSQGFTEYGKLRHGRFYGFELEEKKDN